METSNKIELKCPKNSQDPLLVISLELENFDFVALYVKKRKKRFLKHG